MAGNSRLMLPRTQAAARQMQLQASRRLRGRCGRQCTSPLTDAGAGEESTEVIFGPADGYPNNSESDVFINKTETSPIAVPINFEDAQTNKPISLSYKDEYELPLKFSLSNNSGIAGNHLIKNPLMIDLMVISDGAVFKGQVFNFKYLFIEVD